MTTLQQTAADARADIARMKRKASHKKAKATYRQKLNAEKKAAIIKLMKLPVTKIREILSTI